MLSEKSLKKILLLDDAFCELLNDRASLLDDLVLNPELESIVFYNLLKNNGVNLDFAYSLMKLFMYKIYFQYSFFFVNDFSYNVADKIKTFFSLNAKMFPFDDIKSALKKFLKNDKAVLCDKIPFNKPSNGWWLYLLDTDKQIFSKLTPDFIDVKDSEQYYAVAKILSNPDYDRSFIVVETSAVVGVNWIKTVLLKIKIPIYRVVESIATYKKNVVHLIEITGNIDQNDKRFGKVIQVSDVKLQLLKKIGGYFQFVQTTDIDNLVEFSK